MRMHKQWIPDPLSPPQHTWEQGFSYHTLCTYIRTKANQCHVNYGYVHAQKCDYSIRVCYDRCYSELKDDCERIA